MANRPPSSRLVLREKSQSYLLVSLVSFAGTVILTRLFLEITGYPRLGHGEIHIAHVLWGGLALFLAAILPLIFIHRRVFMLSALLSGVGIGLFIDEVGKFITTTNDYFYPAAAPIIYAFFLGLVLLYIRLKRLEKPDPRTRLYQILEDFSEILDGDLEIEEQKNLEVRISRVIQETEDPDLVRLAQSLLQFIRAEDLRLVVHQPGKWERLLRSGWQITDRIPRRTFKWFLITALILVGGIAWFELGSLIQAISAGGSFLENLILLGVLHGEVRSQIGAYWFIIHLIFQGLVGLSAISSGLFLIFNKDQLALSLGTISMIFSLTAVNLLYFFVDQFSAAFAAVIQLLVLLGLSQYRRKLSSL